MGNHQRKTTDCLIECQAMRRASCVVFWATAATPRTTSPTTITEGLPKPSLASVAVSVPSVQTAWRCCGRLACWMMASGVLAALSDSLKRQSDRLRS